MPVTVRGTDILFNDGSTQVTSALPSSFSAIGSIMHGANFSTSNLFPGNTVAGSSILYPTAFSITPLGTASGAGQAFLEGSQTNGFITSYWYFADSQGWAIRGSRIGNVGAFQPNNTTTLPGTWRVLSGSRSRNSRYNDYEGVTDIFYTAILLQRIS